MNAYQRQVYGPFVFIIALLMAVVIHLYVIAPTKPEGATGVVLNCTEEVHCRFAKVMRCYTTVFVTLVNSTCVFSSCCTKRCADNFPPGAVVDYFLPCSADRNDYEWKLVGLWLPVSLFILFWVCFLCVNYQQEQRREEQPLLARNNDL